jgi:hypothetical protein
MPSFINEKIQYNDPKTLEETIRREKGLYYQHRGNPTFQRDLEDKKKFNRVQRQKGNKPPFFRNSFQGKPVLREPRMAEVGGKRPRNTPMQCWGCNGDHSYRYFPHIKEKVIFFHHVHQVETMEGMGIRVSRIYVALDKNQAEFQSHMIEVEGMINKHDLTIFIIFP